MPEEVSVALEEGRIGLGSLFVESELEGRCWLRPQKEVWEALSETARSCPKG